MEPSMFLEWVQKYFPGIVIKVTETLNDTNRPLTYLHRQLLTLEYSVDGKWQTTSVSNSIVAADIVALDSPLPLKQRPKSSKASGEIPKMGMELWLNETQLTQLNQMVKIGSAPAQIVAKMFQDTPRVLQGIYERVEALFLEALSSGLVLVEDDDKNTGTGIRLDYNYQHSFVSATRWADDDAKPFSDLERIKAQAAIDGNVIRVWMLDQNSINYLLASKEALQLYAQSLRIVADNVPAPTLDDINRAAQAKYGYTFQVVDRSVRYEKNAKFVNYKPWKEGSVIGLQDATNVGSLVWADLAEAAFPVAGVQYQTSDGYILLSKYRKNEPALSEYTRSQARVIPVINNTDQIYMLDTTQSAAGNPPTISAGGDLTTTTASKQITGASATADGDKEIESIKWSKISGPAGSTIANNTTLTPTINGMVTGTYVYRLVVKDSAGLESADDVTITATIA